jgi:hypothetical protein
MKHAPAIQSPAPAQANEQMKEVTPSGSPSGAESKWSAVRHVRLPHKVGVPLGCDGCGCGSPD